MVNINELNLLNNVAVKWSEYKDSHSLVKEDYNIFKILEVSDKEVFICRLLADMINPMGMHHKGRFYLKRFLEDVLEVKEVDEDFISNCEVEKEYLIPNTGRRIDIVIHSDALFIPIEFKINAGEQKSQCYDYYQYAKKQNGSKETVLYYITKYGTYPSPYSTSKYDGDDKIIDMLEPGMIVPVSFREKVVYWLREMISYEDIYSGWKSIMEQYLKVVEGFTGINDKELDKMITDTLLENEDNFRSGLHIANAINTAKAKLIVYVMKEFEKQMVPVMEKYNIKEELNYNYYTYREQATEEFYTTKKYSTFPGINYVVASLDENYQLWFRIEIEHQLFAGFCVFDCSAGTELSAGDKVTDRSRDLEKKVSEYLGMKNIDCSADNWWVKYVYLPTGSSRYQGETEMIPDFRIMNDAAVELVDKGKRERFVTECIEVIEGVLLDRLLEE